MMKFKKHIALVFLMTISIVLGSCGISRNGNFTKQKFTKLKQFSSFDEAREENSTLSFDSESDVAIEDNFDQTSDTDSSFTKNEYSIESIEIKEDHYGLLEKTEIEKETLKKDGKLRGNQREFEKLSIEEQNRQRVKFRKAMNISLLFLALAALAILLGVFYVWAFFGLIALVPAFISALVAVTAVKRVDREKQSDSFKLRHFVMYLVVTIGVIACIVSLTMWIILLILWGGRVI